VTYVEGTDGFPAFAIGNANLRSPHKLVVPTSVEEFSIIVTMKTTKPHGYLFAIVNSRDTIIQLGLKISPAANNHMNVVLVYNDPAASVPETNNGLASFQLPYNTKNWINFSIKVLNHKIALYHNCILIQEVNVTKEPRELVFEAASTFYLGQAGSIIKEKFEVSGSFTLDFLSRCCCLLLLAVTLSTTVYPVCFSTRLGRRVRTRRWTLVSKMLNEMRCN